MSTDYELVNDQLLRYQYARDNGHVSFITKARICNAMFLGDQWAPEVRAYLESNDLPALTFNKVLPATASILSETIAAKADIGFKPAKEGTEETSEALNKVFINISNMNRLPILETDAVEDAIITSRGYLDVRMNFDTNIFGDIQVSLINSRNVLPDPDAEEYDPDKWKDVFVSKWLTLNDISRMYGKAAAEEVSNYGPESPSHSGHFGADFYDRRPGTFGGERLRMSPHDYDRRYDRYRILERQFREVRMVEHYVDLITGETKPIPPGTSREKIQYILENFDFNVIKRRAETIRWRTTSSSVLLHNSESPYRHFTPIPYFPYFRHGQTMGLVENMVDPQRGYNKSRSQELHVVNTTANSGWQMEEGQLANMDEEELQERGAQTGLVITRKPGTPELKKIPPNPIPTGLDRISYTTAEDLKEVSMVSDSMRGFDRADVAARAIQQKQAQGSSNFARVLQNIDRSRGILARNTLDLVQTFYTEERTLQITGGVSGDQVEQITINEVTPEGRILRDMTVGEYEVVVSSVPARETHAESEFQQAVQLRELGVDIPDSVLITSSNLSNKREILEPMTDEPSPEEQQAMQLELHIKQLEAAKLEADTRYRQSETALNMVKAQSEQQTTPISADDRLKAEELQQNQEEMLAKLELEKYRIDQELEVKREALRIERLKISQQQVTDLAKIRVQREQAQTKQEQPKQEQPAQTKTSGEQKS